MSEAIGMHLPQTPQQSAHPSSVFMQSQPHTSNFKTAQVANTYAQPIDTNASQAFCLRWNNYQSNLTAIFEQLLQNEQFVDVTLCCDGSSIKAHKMVLSACSPYFQSLFNDNPCKHPIVILRDVKFTELKAVVEFMYRGEIDVCQDQITPLLQVAELLKVRGLADVSADQKIEVETAPLQQIKMQEIHVADLGPVDTIPLVNTQTVAQLVHSAPTTPAPQIPPPSAPPPPPPPPPPPTLTSAPSVVAAVIEPQTSAAHTENAISAVEYWNNNYSLDVTGRIESKTELKRKKTNVNVDADGHETPNKRSIKSEVHVVGANAENYSEVIGVALDGTPTPAAAQTTSTIAIGQPEDAHSADLVIDEDKSNMLTYQSTICSSANSEDYSFDGEDMTSPPSGKSSKSYASFLKMKAPVWTQQQLREAIDAVVTQKLRFTQASVRYNIPKGTLYDNILGKANRMLVLEVAGLDAKAEKAVLEYCCDVSVSPYNRRTNRPLSSILGFVQRESDQRTVGQAKVDFSGKFGFRWWWAFCKKHSIVSLYYDANANCVTK